MWNVLDADEIKPHTLELMNFVKPRPDYLIIGTGEINVNLPANFYEHFKRMGIVVDTCPSVRNFANFSLRHVARSICALRMIITWLALCSGLILVRAKTTQARDPRMRPTHPNFKKANTTI
jgi:hypothetical protein